MSKALKKETQSKNELKNNVEEAVQGKHYVPRTDIVETEKELTVIMDMPGVARDNLSIKLEKGVLEVSGRVNFDLYQDWSPVYSEYNVGHFTRGFRLSNKIDQDKIEAVVRDGVLTVHLPKVPDAEPRKISVR